MHQSIPVSILWLVFSCCQNVGSLCASLLLSLHLDLISAVLHLLATHCHRICTSFYLRIAGDMEIVAKLDKRKNINGVNVQRTWKNPVKFRFRMVIRSVELHRHTPGLKQTLWYSESIRSERYRTWHNNQLVPKLIWRFTKMITRLSEMSYHGKATWTIRICINKDWIR